MLVLSAGKEAARLGHLVAVLSVCADHPGHSDDAAHDEAHDGRVGLPVGGLRVPTTGRRPDVLWVSAAVRRAILRPLSRCTYGILPPPPMIASCSADWWGSRSWRVSRSRDAAEIDYRLCKASLAEKFGQARLDTGSTHDTVQLLLRPVLPSRPHSKSSLFNEANSRVEMRLATAGSPIASTAVMSLCRGEEYTAEHRTS
jgi:hypothetical protein